MGFKINKVKADLCSYPPYVLLAERKFGKTTFWYELVKEAWGADDKGLLISFGTEEGYHALDGIQVEVAKKWNAPYDEETDLRGFVQIVDDIVENNDKYGLKGVCFDTLDTMVDVATAEVLRQHRKEKGTICKTLNESFGGFSRGVERLVNLIVEQETRLRDAGLAVFYLCHTKNKEKTDLKSGEKYEQITNNLQSNIYTKIADSAQMVMVGIMEREINSGKLISEERVVYLRGNSQVDAGSRFSDLPEKIALNPKEFLDAFEYGVRTSIKGKKDNETLDKMKAAEEKDREKHAAVARANDSEQKKTNEELNLELIDVIKSNFMDATDDVKNQVKEIMAKYNIPNFKDSDVSTEGLQLIVDILQKN